MDYKTIRDSTPDERIITVGTDLLGDAEYENDLRLMNRGVGSSMESEYGALYYKCLFR